MVCLRTAEVWAYYSEVVCVFFLLNGKFWVRTYWPLNNTKCKVLLFFLFFLVPVISTDSCCFLKLPVLFLFPYLNQRPNMFLLSLPSFLICPIALSLTFTPLLVLYWCLGGLAFSSWQRFLKFNTASTVILEMRQVVHVIITTPAITVMAMEFCSCLCCIYLLFYFFLLHVI